MRDFRTQLTAVSWLGAQTYVTAPLMRTTQSFQSPEPQVW